MDERKSLSSFRCVLYWFILLLGLGSILSFLPQFLFNQFIILEALPKLFIALGLGIITDLVLFIVTTNIISKRYKTSHKPNFFLILSVIIFSLIITFTSYYPYLLNIKDLFIDKFGQIFPSFVSYANFLNYIFLYCFILIPRLIMTLFINKKLYSKEKDIKIDTPHYKIESEEPVYQKIDTTTNKIISNENIKQKDVWSDDEKLEEKNILIVPEKKEEVKIVNTPISSISIKPIVTPKKEQTPSDLTQEGAIPFEGLIPGVNPYEKPVEPKKIVKQEPINYPSEHIDRICPNCGAKVSDSATTCFMCGKPL